MNKVDTNTPPIAIFVHGALGRVGHITLDLAARAPGFEVVGGADLKSDDSVREGDITIHSALPGDLPKDTVVIDFTLAGAVGPLVDKLHSRGNPLVSGTTGLGVEEKDALRVYSKIAPVLYDENMSYGISVLKKVLETAAPLMRDVADTEIVEFHHVGKRDYPSGTAYALARVIDPGAAVVSGRQGDAGTGRSIAIHSGRVGGLPGEHRVVFATGEEMIAIEHRAITRDVFARGALRAARFVSGKHQGLFSMKDLLEAKNE